MRRPSSALVWTLATLAAQPGAAAAVPPPNTAPSTLARRELKYTSGGIVREGLALEMKGLQLRNARVPMPQLPALDDHTGWTVDVWLTLFDVSAGQILFDARDSRRQAGLALATAAEASLALEVIDGQQRAIWRCAPEILRSNTLQHLVLMVDGHSKTVTVMVDGRLQVERQGRLACWTGPDQHAVAPPTGSLPGGTLRTPWPLNGYFKSLRIYRRCLRPEEARSHYLVEKSAPVVRESPPPPITIDCVQAPFPMPQFTRPVFPERTFDIRRHGAKGDGVTPDTQAIARAITACARAGGGRVLVPKGTWVTGAIHLKSNVELHLQEGAVLRFSTRPEDYLPVVFTRWAGFECYNYSPLIYARGCTNIAITGKGLLDGQGEAWWHWVAEQPRMAGVLLEAGRTAQPVAERVYGRPAQPLRPQFVSPIHCTNVFLEGIALNSGPFWTIHCIYCENVVVRGITVDNYGPNNDGVDVDSCRNVVIEHCEFNTGDDSVVLKSGLNEDGWRVGRPTENVVLRHCLMKQGHGVLSIGSEMSGDVRNVFAHNCSSRGNDCGVRLKSARGRGGLVENVWVEDMDWADVRSTAIYFTTFYTAWAVTAQGRAPVFRNLNLRNIRCDGADAAARIVGLEERPLMGVTLDRLRISSRTGIAATNVTSLKILDCDIRPQVGPILSLMDNQEVVIQRLAVPSTGSLLHLEGDKTRSVHFVNLNTNDAARISFGAGVDRHQLTLE
jgi:hypothetical protein